ncbi:MAG: GAF domain-containing protein, partial [Thermoleophilia bacterium]
TREWGLFQVLADRASMAVQNSWLHEETKKELDRVRLLRDVAAACAESQDMRAIAKHALEAVDEKMGCFRASVYYLDKERNALVNLAFIGHSPKVMDEFKESSLDRGTLLTRAVLERRMITHEEVNLDNATEDEGYILKALDIGHNRRCTLPLIYKKEVVGGMAIVFPDKYSFRPGEIQTIKGVANQLAVAIHGSRHPVESSGGVLESQSSQEP